MKHWYKLFLAFFLALFFVACASDPVKETPQAKIEEPAPSKKPTLKEVVKKRSRDSK